MVNAGEQTRATDLRGLVREKEAEIVTLDRLAVIALIEIPQVCSLKFLTCEQRSV